MQNQGKSGQQGFCACLLGSLAKIVSPPHRVPQLLGISKLTARYFWGGGTISQLV